MAFRDSYAFSSFVTRLCIHIIILNIYSKERTIRREREIPFTSSISAMDSIVPFLSNDKVSVLSRPDSWNLGLRTMVT